MAAPPRAVVALIDEARCIGCARCIEACPFDAIVGARGRMHTVVVPWCSGCELCLPPCPVDCIAPVPAPEWTDAERRAAAQRVRARKQRLLRRRVQPSAGAAERRAVLAEVLRGRRP